MDAIYSDHSRLSTSPPLDASMTKDLLEPIWSSLPMDGVSLAMGPDMYDVFQFEDTAVVKYHSRLVLPAKMNDFLIAGTLQTDTDTGGYIFTVMNPSENIIQLGVHLGPVANTTRNISLYYTDVHQEEVPRESMEMAVFQIPDSKDTFRFAFKLLVDEVIFYYECEEKESVHVHRDPSELEFDQASIVYIGQAGDLLKGNFQVSLSLIRKQLNLQNETRYNTPFFLIVQHDMMIMNGKCDTDHQSVV